MAGFGGKQQAKSIMSHIEWVRAYKKAFTSIASLVLERLLRGRYYLHYSYEECEFREEKGCMCSWLHRANSRLRSKHNSRFFSISESERGSASWCQGNPLIYKPTNGNRGLAVRLQRPLSLSTLPKTACCPPAISFSILSSYNSAFAATLDHLSGASGAGPTAQIYSTGSLRPQSCWESHHY